MNDLKNHKPKVLVIGDLMIDHYLWGTCQRISPEAPVQVINVENESTVLGGAGNVIKNLQALGAKVDVISVIGLCKTSKEIIKLLQDINISTKNLISEKNRVSSRKSRIISGNQQVIRYDFETTTAINDNSSESILKLFNSIVNNYDVILLSDYGKGILTHNLTQSIIQISNENNKKILIDPKGSNYSKYKGAYLLTPNKKEAAEATNVNIQDNESLEKAIKLLKENYDLNISIITLSEQGVAIFDNELRIHPTTAKEVFDVTGAGDTILASLGFALSCGKTIDEAIEFANLASGIVVGKIGSSTATIEEIIDYGLSFNKLKTVDLIKNTNEISQIVKDLKKNQKKIVFTNGCFDILHVGHICLLESAKSFGDVLIVGLNSDKSVSALKGKQRPLNTQADRAYILAALEVVDYVVIFNQETPYELIKKIKPNTLVKGKDYDGQHVVGQDIADELKLVKLVDGRSSTKTIKKIQKGI
jgi:D-beta-D-heptose 7-phosphate kinase / D-beta-D-heptose 1-phosphate adenosyltransferase